MMHAGLVARHLSQAGEKALAADIEVSGTLEGTRASLVELPDLDVGGTAPAVYYTPGRRNGKFETHYRLLPLDSGGWKFRERPKIRLSDSLHFSSDNPAKSLLYRTLSLVLTGEAERTRSGAPPFRMWVSALLSWRQSVSRDGRSVYRYMICGFPAVFADPDQTLRWNAYAQGPVSWDEYRSPFSMHELGDLPHGVISRSEEEAVAHAERLISDWGMSFVVPCRRASPAQYSGTTQIIADWRDVLEGVNRRWPGYSTLAEMM